MTPVFCNQEQCIDYAQHKEHSDYHHGDLVPVCCNKLIGPPLWLLSLMITNNTATVVNPGALLLDALLINTKVYFC